MRIFRFFWGLFFLGVIPVQAHVQEKIVEYESAGETCEGRFVWSEDFSGKRPGVLVCHAWMGPGEHEREFAGKLAALGYRVFIADIYGKNVRPKDTQEAAQQAGKYKGDRKLLRKRVQSALLVLKSQKNVDAGKTAALGFCFGGTTVLELARSGADVLGVVSFHGGLDTKASEDAKNIRGKVLVLHGADDPYSPLSEVMAFIDEMKKGGVDYEVVLYGGAVHSFTDKKAASDGARYHPEAAVRSFERMKDFLKEIFKEN